MAWSDEPVGSRVIGPWPVMVKITATIATRVALSAAPSTSSRQATSSITGGMTNSSG